MTTSKTPQADPQAFAKKFLGITLQPHQQKAILAPGWCKTILKGRQSGATTTLVLKALWSAYRHARHLILIVSASERQAVELGERIMDLVDSSPLEASITRRTSERLTFSNGSEVFLLPNNPKTVRGYGARRLRKAATPPGVLVGFDECAHAENGEQTRRAIEFCLAAAPDRRELWLVSTPTTSDSWVQRFYEFGQQKVDGYWSTRWPSETNRFVDHAWVQRMRETRLPSEIACEIDGLPADSAEALFAPLLAEAVHDELPWPVPPRLDAAYSVGIDLVLPFSPGKDKMAAVLLARTAEAFIVSDYFHERVYRDQDLVDILDRWTRRYGVGTILVENFGSTGVVEGCMAKGLPVETVPPTTQRQANAFLTLYSAARQGQLWIPAGAAALIAELKILTHTMRDNGVPKFSAPAGRHDDLCFGLAWAAAAHDQPVLNLAATPMPRAGRADPSLVYDISQPIMNYRRSFRTEHVSGGTPAGRPSLVRESDGQVISRDGGMGRVDWNEPW